MVSISIYNLKIDTIYMYDIPIDRSFILLSNGIRHVMPSTDTKPELTARASVAQPVSQPSVYANVLTKHDTYRLRRTRLEGVGENYIMRNSMICIPHPILCG
jgi:hypothetical protein